MAYKQKGHYGKYSGNAGHSKHHMTNSWEEQDVRRGKKQMAEGHKGHAKALFDDAHGSYNYNGHNSTGPERSESPLDFFGGAISAIVGGIRGKKSSRSRMKQHTEVMETLGRIEQEIGGGEESVEDGVGAIGQMASTAPDATNTPAAPSEPIAEDLGVSTDIPTIEGQV